MFYYIVADVFHLTFWAANTIRHQNQSHLEGFFEVNVSKQLSQNTETEKYTYLA